MIDPTIKKAIEGCVNEMRAYKPAWDEEDIFYAACGSVLKIAESKEQEVNPELLETIQVVVKQKMKGN